MYRNKRDTSILKLFKVYFTFRPAREDHLQRELSVRGLGLRPEIQSAAAILYGRISLMGPGWIHATG